LHITFKLSKADGTQGQHFNLSLVTMAEISTPWPRQQAFGKANISISAS